MKQARQQENKQRVVREVAKTDVEQRKSGEQKGLETPVVQTVNDVYESEVLLRG